MAVTFDRRLHAPRLPTNLKAQIVLPLQKAVHCFITEISPAGARLIADPHHVLPPVLALQLFGDETLFYCDLVWRKERHVGVTIARDQWRFWWIRSQAFNRRGAAPRECSPSNNG